MPAMHRRDDVTVIWYEGMHGARVLTKHHGQRSRKCQQHDAEEDEQVDQDAVEETEAMLEVMAMEWIQQMQR